MNVYLLVCPVYTHRTKTSGLFSIKAISIDSLRLCIGCVQWHAQGFSKADGMI